MINIFIKYLCIFNEICKLIKIPSTFSKKQKYIKNTLKIPLKFLNKNNTLKNSCMSQMKFKKYTKNNLNFFEETKIHKK